MVPDRYRFSRLLLRPTGSAGDLSSRSEDSRLDNIRHKLVAGRTEEIETVLCTLETLHETKFVTWYLIRSLTRSRVAREGIEVFSRVWLMDNIKHRELGHYSMDANITNIA